MKRITVAAFLCMSVLAASAQKKPLDHDVYDSWQNISKLTVSDDGRYLFYTVNPGQGDGTLFIRCVDDGRELAISRGQQLSVAEDASYAIFSIKPQFSKTREAKIKKKKDMPKDSLAYVDLSTFAVEKIAKVNSFKSVTSGPFTFAYETGKKDSTVLVVVRPGVMRDTLRNVKSYGFDRRGCRMTAVYKDSVCMYFLPSMERMTLSSGKKYYSNPVFDDSGRKAAFLASADSAKTGNKHCSVFLYEEKVTGKGRKAVLSRHVSEIVPQDYSGELPEGFCVTENADPYFSRCSDRLLLGISKFIPEDDSTLYSFETAGLDIWNWDVYMTPPIQKAALERLKKKTRLSVVNLSDTSYRVIPLAASETDRISLVDGGQGDFALSTDDGNYQIEASWDSNEKQDVALVDMNDGSRRPLFTGLDARVSASPKGRYLIWYSGADSSWFSYRIADGRKINLTASVDGVFYDDEDDHPYWKPSLGGPKWFADDKALLLDEKFGLYKFQPDGDYAVDITAGAGRKDSVRFRYVQMTRDTVSGVLSKAGVRQTLPLKGTLYMTAFDLRTRENGFATVDASATGLKSSFTAPYSYPDPVKALNSPTVAYKKGNFSKSPDVHITSDLWKTEEKLSSTNPQQKDYLWGDIRLVHWKAYDGTPLDGLLILPENLDTTASYPMMVYFYERYSDELFTYRRPAPSASTVNWPFYASRGYVVFVPDIRYRDGHPGECAYNCVCSGCEAMCARYGFIDSKRMAIQGQSWGGYQTAYLVTRTDMFAAAGAGAPVGNMTSAYGGIRWSTGIVRAMQYEHGQSRIGKSLWDEGGLDLYIENSPIFHTQNVTTPVLIMHNDADGAVPWYQGIEFFMSLRRFHHPAWLLQYNGEEHNLRQWKNKVDLSKRLQQFFDHYLKGEPMPAWMKNGVPMVRKGQYFGFETE